MYNQHYTMMIERSPAKTSQSILCPPQDSFPLIPTPSTSGVLFFIIIIPIILILLQYILCFNLTIMIAAKREAFREEIRKRQIDEKIKSKRKELLLNQKIHITKVQQQQVMTEFHNLMYNSSSLTGTDDYYVYQCLHDLSVLLKKNKKSISLFCKQEFLIIQQLGSILTRINQSAIQDDNKIAIFQFMSIILSQIIQSPIITVDRIIASKIIEAIVPYLSTARLKIDTISKVLYFLANATKDSPQVSRLYTKFGFIKKAIRLIQINNPKAGDRILGSFLYFLRSHLQEINKPPQLTQDQINTCVQACRAVIEQLLQQDLSNQEYADSLEDALKVFKSLINFQLFSCDVSDVQKCIEMVHTKGYPIQIKRQSLLIIDHIVFIASSEIMQDLVRQKQMLNRIWSIDEQLKFIVYNIISNLAIQSSMLPFITPFLSRLRLEMVFNPNKKYIYRCMLNYFTTKKFQVEGVLEESIISQLYTSEIKNPDILQIEAQIWLGLVAHDYYQKPPERILQARHLPIVDDIWHCLERGADNSMEDQYENIE